MGRNRKNRAPEIIENLEITDFGGQGKSLSKNEGQIVFVPFGMPGDIGDVMVTKKKKNFKEARWINLKVASELRQTPKCSHFGTCGGCKWQHVPYSFQERFKGEQVASAFEHSKIITYPDPEPTIGSKNIFEYRNKLEFTFSSSKWLTQEEIESEKELERSGLGFHIPGRFDKVLDIVSCKLQEETQNKIRNWVRNYAISKGLSFYNLRDHEGFLRTLMVRNNRQGEWMVVFQFGLNDELLINSLLNALSENFNQIKSLHYTINTKKNDSWYDLDIKLFKGLPYLEESVNGLRFKIRPKSFFQTNSDQAEVLYQIVAEKAKLTGKETVFDLYSGTGTIGLFLADKAKEIIGVETVPDAVEDAIENAKLNGIDNATFHCSDAKDFMKHLAEKGQSIDVLITDPPREGMHPDVVQAIMELKPAKIIYVSCKPPTQIRDLEILQEAYSIDFVQPVDMFPHTHHVENVVELNLK